VLPTPAADIHSIDLTFELGFTERGRRDSAFAPSRNVECAARMMSARERRIWLGVFQLWKRDPSARRISSRGLTTNS